MIRGIGTDIVYISRIENVRDRFGERFLRRFLSRAEYDEYQRRKASASFLAKRFAAKEAAAKALGVGIGKGARLREIEVLNDANGKPVLHLHGETARTAQRLGVSATHIAISDERDIAQAFVVLE